MKVFANFTQAEIARLQETYQAQLQQRDLVISQKTAQLEQCTNTVQRQNVQLREKDEELQQKETQLQQRNADNNRLQRELQRMQVCMYRIKFMYHLASYVLCYVLRWEEYGEWSHHLQLTIASVHKFCRSHYHEYLSIQVMGLWKEDLQHR